MPLSLPQIPLPPSITQRLVSARAEKTAQPLPEQYGQQIAQLAALTCYAELGVLILADDFKRWFAFRGNDREVLRLWDDSLYAELVLEPSRAIAPGSATTYLSEAIRSAEGRLLGAIFAVNSNVLQTLDEKRVALRALGSHVGMLLEAHHARCALEKQCQILEEARAASAAYAHELQEMNLLLQRQSMLDGLTGVHNRRAFDLKLASACSSGEPVSLILLDIDHFKTINDTYGHHVGDEILRRLAATLLDQVQLSGFVARYGGEEFAILMQGESCVRARPLGAALRDIIRSNQWLEHPVTVSIGIASTSDHFAGSLLSVADGALYRAKGLGRDQVCFASGS